MGARGHLSLCGLAFVAACAAVRPPAEAPPPPPANPVVYVRTSAAVVQADGAERVRVVHGSGFLVGSGARVVTCRHVVDLAGGRVEVVLDPGTAREATCDARVVAFDAGGDLALLTLDRPPAGVAGLPLAEEPPRPGCAVRAVGYAQHGGWREAAGHVTRVLPANGTGTLKGRVETDAEVVAGQSGGPLLSEDGTVYGVIVERERAHSRAVPVDYLRRRLAQWR